jgi:predicted esterase
MLVDVQRDSPEFGRRVPVVLQFRAGGSRFWPTYTLAVAPAPGFPLRPSTQYAVVITNRVRGIDGEPLRRDADFDELMGDSPSMRLRAASMLIKPALMRIPGLDLASVVSATVFTTSDPTSEFFRAVEVTLNSARMPETRAISRIGSNDVFVTYRGAYGPNPVFQAGEPPYLAEGSGDFVSGPDGNPVIQRYETEIQFALTVPTGAMPPGGWPIAIYAHGTGGNASSFISDGTARALAQQGIACLGFDQLFNGARTIRGGSPESQFFNFANPYAARSNNRQAAIDLVQAGRFVRVLTIPSAVSHTAEDVRFDGANVMFFGHSQGGLNGPLWLATASGPQAAVLSGAGGWLSLSLVMKTEPVDIPGLVAGLLSVPRAELTPLHPAVTLAQTIADPADTVHYARFIVREPRAGGAPKHVFMTQGFIDHYTPPPAIAALAVSIGLPLVAPVLHREAIGPLPDWPTVDAPVRRNLAMGAATGGWSQYNAVGTSDGHFVVFDDPAAQRRAARFLATFASDPAMGPTIE